MAIKNYTSKKQEVIHGDSLHELKKFEGNSVDLVCTDPPYGYSFMGKSWDKTLPDIGIFDVCARMMLLLEDAGFEIGFTPIYWTYASGFPKAMNIGKMVDKRNGTSPDESREFAAYIKGRRQELGITLSRADDEVCGGTTNYSWFEGRPKGQRLPRLAEYERMKILLQLDDRYDAFMGEAEREVIGKYASDMGGLDGQRLGAKGGDITIHATPQAKALEGSYGGFQPKPAVEVVIVAMKPLSEKTFVDQALKNGKGITWLDDCRIPSNGEHMVAGTVTKQTQVTGDTRNEKGAGMYAAGSSFTPTNHEGGRFPANLLVSDDVLNDGTISKSQKRSAKYNKPTEQTNTYTPTASDYRDDNTYADSGSYSRYFNLDAWAKTLPFLVVPKASKGEKNEGLDGFAEKERTDYGGFHSEEGLTANGRNPENRKGAKNHHPTVKPLKLMSYLITLGSREGDVVLDPFLGSGTTALAAKNLNRRYIGIEREAEYVEIAKARLREVTRSLFVS